MAFSFSNWFKKPADSEPADEQPSSAAPPPEAPVATVAPPTPVARPKAAPMHMAPPTLAPVQAVARPSKTVLPNSVRPVNLHDSARPVAHGGPAAAIPSSVSLRSNPAVMPAAPTPRAISFPGIAPTAAAPPSPAPIAPAPAPAPAPVSGSTSLAAPNASISLALGEFVDHIPASLLKAGAPVDRNRTVIFQAADLYSDLTRGRAAVPVSTIQAVCPDLFSRPISPTEDVEVALPLQKLVEQLGTALQTRADQVAEDDVAEIETPFLQVALEDSVRLPKPPPSTPPRPHIAAVPPAPVAARRPAEPIPEPAPVAPTVAADTVPGEIAGAGSATALRPLTPRSVHISPVRRSGGGEPTPASLTGTPGVPSGITAPSQSTVAPINPAKRPPSTVRASVAGGKIRLSGPAISSRSIAPHAAASPASPVPPPPATIKPNPAAPTAPSPASMPAQKKTARIQIPAISLRSGAGNSGSSGAPTAPPPRGAGQPAPAPKPSTFPEFPMAFRATPGETPAGATPTPALPPLPVRSLVSPPPLGRAPILPSSPPLMAFTAPPPPEPPPAPQEETAPASAAAASMIPLALGPILRSLPAAMFPAGLDGNAAAEHVPDDARVELPLAFITAQLAQGRVAVPRDQFVAAMPEAFRHLLPAEAEPAEVVIPLQEVFQSLPTGALNRRQDQLVEEVGPEIPTPFSMKAQEDAARLQAAADAAASIPEPEPEPEPLAPPVSHAVVAEPEPVVAEETFAPELAASPVEETPNPAPEAVATAEQPPADVLAHPAPEETFTELAAPLAADEAAPFEAPAEPAAHAAGDAAPPTAVAPEEEQPVAQAEAVDSEVQTVGDFSEAPTAPAAHEHVADVAEVSPIEARSMEGSEPALPEAPTPAAETTDADLPVVADYAAENPVVESAGHPELEPAPAPSFSEPEAQAMPPVTHEPVPEESNSATAEETLTEEHSFVAPAEQQSLAPVAAELASPAAPSEDGTEHEPEAPPVPRVIVPAALIAPAGQQPELEMEPAAINGSGGRTEKPAHPSPASTEEAQEALRAIFMVDDDLDAKKIVKLVNQLPGLKACAVMFADGLKLAGSLESVSSGEGFCAMTPPFFRRVGNYARELNLGEIQCVTLQTERALLSFFMQGDICLSVQHAGNRSFLPGVREKLLSATGELAKMYALPAASH